MIHFDKLVEIYASDLAKGNKVKGPGEESQWEDNDELGQDEPEAETQPIDEGVADSTTRGTATTTPLSSRQSLKRKNIEVDSIDEHIKSISTAISKALEVQAEVLAPSGKNPNPAIGDVFKAISTIPGLSQEQVIEAYRCILHDPLKIDAFLQLPDDYKTVFVKAELKGKGL